MTLSFALHWNQRPFKARRINFDMTTSSALSAYSLQNFWWSRLSRKPPTLSPSSTSWYRLSALLSHQKGLLSAHCPKSPTGWFDTASSSAKISARVWSYDLRKSKSYICKATSRQLVMRTSESHHFLREIEPSSQQITPLKWPLKNV